MDGTRILSAAQKGTLYTASPSGHLHTHIQIYKNSYCNRTHTHLERKTLLCILTIWIASRLLFMGISERYNRIDIEPGLSAPAIEIPSTIDESSSGGRGRDASLPAVKFLQAFLICFPATASLRWQIPQFMSPRVASLLSCVQLCGLKSLCSFQQMIFKELLSVE